MFAPPVAKLQAKTPTRGPTVIRPAGQQAKRLGPPASEAASAVSWDFSAIPIFPSDRAGQTAAPALRRGEPGFGFLQPKLAIGSSDDPLEHEADRIAEHVMRMPAPKIAPAFAPLPISRKCAACEAQEERLRKKPTGVSKTGFSEAPAGVYEALRAPGQPLDQATRAFFEPRFGRDFSAVRIHADDHAKSAANTIQAHAYTLGRDIAFANGQYAPATSAGRHLLAHELAHVIQQHHDSSSSAIQRQADRAAQQYSSPAPSIFSASRSMEATATPDDSGRISGTLTRAQGHRASRSPSTSSQHESGEDYIDYLQAIHDLTMAASPRRHGAGLPMVTIGNVSDQHLGLLEELRLALTLVYQSKPNAGRNALAIWDSIQGELWASLRRAPRFVHGDIRQLNELIGEDLNYINDELIRPAAYRDAHRQALEHSQLQAPDLADLQTEFEQQERELKEAEDLPNELGELASEGIAEAVLRDANKGKEIFELVNLPGDINEKLEQAKNKGIVSQAATAVDLVSAIAKLKTTVIETTFDYLKDRAEGLAKEALSNGADELAEHWTSLAEGYEAYAENLKTVGTVLGLVGAAADAVKAFNSALHGDWEAAAGHAAKAGVGVLSALGPEGSAPLIGAAVILFKIELAAMHMAAEFIRWCKDETVREAAQAFIDVCVKVAKRPAQDLVADAEALLDPANASIQDSIQRQLLGYQSDMKKGFQAIFSEVECTEPQCLGGHGDLVAALGQTAFEAIMGLSYPDDPLSMAQRIADIFVGANKMAKYVHSAYPTDAEKRVQRGKKSSDE